MKNVRGYIFSRSFMGERVPQHVQNQVIREYCNQNKLQFLLSSTEYVMEDCYLILEQVLFNLDSIDGIVAYSLFQLPEDQIQRKLVYERCIKNNKVLHFAVEGIQARSQEDFNRIEVLWLVRMSLPFCPQVPDFVN
jgi:sporadic carbohydrate cluster protein (TIGR04323 family)